MSDIRVGIRPIYWKNGEVYILDQRLLPHKVKYLRLKTADGVAKAIKDMAIRGAPAIGIAGAMGLALTAYHSREKSVEKFYSKLKKSYEILRNTRPTAMNLFWALDRVMKIIDLQRPVDELRRLILEEALRIMEEDLEANRKVGINGARLINDGDGVLTHCNAGALATAGYGTALGVVRAAFEEGKKIIVYACETRPRLQGSKLTVWELMRDGIPVRLITDNMAAFLMQRGLINKVIVGADRILAKTGHVINKIGTLCHAIAAKYYNIPFLVAAPTSTIDFKSTPEEVVIEERDEKEVLYVDGRRIAPRGARALNPAFDITPPDLVSFIITEKGIYRPEELKMLDSIT